MQRRQPSLPASSTSAAGMICDSQQIWRELMHAFAGACTFMPHTNGWTVSPTPLTSAKQAEQQLPEQAHNVSLAENKAERSGSSPRASLNRLRLC
eukprot:363565-Chlamydomonas_euryale.AAC.12